MKSTLMITPLVLLLSCGTTNKVQQYEAHTDSAASVTDETADLVRTFTDTTRKERGIISVYEVSFAADTAAPPSTLIIPGLGSINGRVNLVRKTTIEKETEKAGRDNREEQKKAIKSNAIVSKSTTKAFENDKAAPDPYRWRYIFGICFIALIGAIWLNRQPIFQWLRKMFAAIKKIP